MSHEQLAYVDDLEIDAADTVAVAVRGLETIDTSTNEAFKEIILGEIVVRLKELGIIDASENSKEEATTVLRWADNNLRQFSAYKSALGMEFAENVKSYLRENSLTPSQWSEEYTKQITERTNQAIEEAMEYYNPEIEEYIERVRSDAEQAGRDAAQIQWRCEQARQEILEYIETSSLKDIRAKVREDVARELVSQEHLPSLSTRYDLLVRMHAMQQTMQASGEQYRLVPIPYQDIMRRIVPAFSPHDTVPKEWPNKGYGLAEFYIDPMYLKVIRGRDGAHPTEYSRTQYAKMDKSADLYGNFGLALFSESQLNGIGSSSKTNTLESVRYSSDSQLSRQDQMGLPEGIVWAMLTADSIFRGKQDIDNKDIKVVLPEFLSSVGNISAAKLSIYRKFKDNPHDRRLGIAIDSLSEQEAKNQEYEALKAIK